MSRPQSSSFIALNYLLLLGIGLIWGSQYFFNKIALECFSNWMITAARVVIGTAVLSGLVAIQAAQKKERASRGSFWRHTPDFILIGFFEATLPCLLIAWAQKQVPSSITAILIGTVPLFATLLEVYFVKNHAISVKKVIAIVLGFLGVLVLVGPGLFSSDLLSSLAVSLPLLPVLALLAASFSFAISVSLIKIRLSVHLPPLQAAQGILGGATVTALPLLLIMSGISTVLNIQASLFPLIALLLLGIFGGGIVYTLYVRLIDRAGPSFASSANYLALPIGAFIGIAFAEEKLTINVLGSLILILIALWLSRGEVPKKG